MELLVNGKKCAVETDPERSLLSVLRDDLALTGAKYGCGEGQCGACTVLLGDGTVRACITPVRRAVGKPVTTIEGLAAGDQLHPLQEAFIAADALQCGYCTAGMILVSAALLRKDPAPTPARIQQSLQGNICRCGTYPRIVRAVQSASRALQAGGKKGAP